MNNNINKALKVLAINLQGELHYDKLVKRLYATDASVYRIVPLAVALPKNEKDIIELIKFAHKNNTSLIPRAAGTSLAGQCVGDGIVVDISKHFNRIINIDEQNKTVTVQPGVVRDQLNNFLKPFNLFFGPNTSTSNRCMIGGMVGNNSSGTTSIKYGVTRDKVISLKTILSDGSKVEFTSLNNEEFEKKLNLNSLEGDIYKAIHSELKDKRIQERIKENFPKPEIHRRNTGYAIDELIKFEPYTAGGKAFNMSKLLTGSEGTLAFTTEITLMLDDLPPPYRSMVVAHFNTVRDCLTCVEPLMKHDLHTCELMDKVILDCTKKNKEQEENRAFVQEDPEALLMLELRAESDDILSSKMKEIISDLKALNLSYANVILEGDEIDKAIELRKAGLGLLGNLIGDEKAVACIEDTAVSVNDLSSYIEEFSSLMISHDQKAVYYAHAGAGELHLRPVLNLKKSNDIKLFEQITNDVATLVKKYNGSMSGEHGDGIVRSSVIEYMIGSENYNLLRKVKSAFDPTNIFNPGKIVDPLPINKNLRYIPDRSEPEINTILDFSDSMGILREAEKCNGSGDCRKLPEFGGTMCPSYHATLNEKDTTRARANALRDFLTNSDKPNKFNHKELKEVFDLCLSCKACATECPSSVNVANLKAEFQYQYQKANGIPLRTKLFAFNNHLNRKASKASKIFNFVNSNRISSYLIKKSMGIASKRSLPSISTKSLDKIYKSTVNQSDNNISYFKTVYLFIDEFTNYLDTEIGVDCIKLLEALNYKVKVIDNFESGRSFISKGLLENAKELANKNIQIFKDLISVETPLLGIEPSSILTFVDEYPKLADSKSDASELAKHVYLVEEFIQQEIRLGTIKTDQFTDEEKHVKFHGHCYQKALRDQNSSYEILNLPKNFQVSIIPSGCCGMAGSFGYEKEHYDISMQIGGQTLFPAINESDEGAIIAANGTSCRHQIMDGTGRTSKHPVTILFEALLDKR